MKPITKAVLELCKAEYDPHYNTVPMLAAKYDVKPYVLYYKLKKLGITRRRSTDPFEKRRKEWFRQAQARAKRKGIEFTLTLQDVVVPARCPVLDIPLSFGTRFYDNSPSLDRVDPTKGYTKENVWVISWRANAIKHNATLAELEKLVNALRIQQTS